MELKTILIVMFISALSGVSTFACPSVDTPSYGDPVILHKDDGGEGALWRDCTSRNEHTAQRWQRIKYTCHRDPEAEWRSYLTIYGRRYYLDEFMHVA